MWEIFMYIHGVYMIEKLSNKFSEIQILTCTCKCVHLSMYMYHVPELATIQSQGCEFENFGEGTAWEGPEQVQAHHSKQLGGELIV